MYKIKIVLFCLLLAGCGLLGIEESADSFELRVDQEAYSPGDTVTVILENNSNHEIGYNLCFSTLERSTSSDWEELGTFVDGACPAVQYTLAPDSEAKYKGSLKADLQEGEYRLQTTVHWETEGENGRDDSHSQDLYTGSFVVKGE